MAEHYYTENPHSEIKEKTFDASLKGHTLQFTSVSGVFAFGQKVDKASELLIKNFSPSGNSLLDVGCGYGAIGLFLKALYPGQDITMIDINQRALSYAKSNARLNDLLVQVLHSNLYENLTGQKFWDIVSNPPIAAGKALNIQLIQEAYDHLEPNGALWLVAFHNKGGSTLKGIMEEAFGNVEDIEKSGGIRVYKSVKR